MRRHVITAALAAAAFSVVGAAQTPRSGTQSDGQRDRSSGTVTVTGCVQDGSGSSGSTSSASPSTKTGSGGYVLANATTGAGSDGNAASRPGATGSTGAGTSTGSASAAPGGTTAGANAMYTLEGKNDDLKKHVGHRVEITGTLASGSGDRAKTTADSSAGGGTSSSAGGTTAGTTGTSATGAAGTTRAASPRSDASGTDMGAGAHGRIRVSSIRMISSDCSASAK
jgi:hypothetical protein